MKVVPLLDDACPLMICVLENVLRKGPPRTSKSAKFGVLKSSGLALERVYLMRTSEFVVALLGASSSNVTWPIAVSMVQTRVKRISIRFKFMGN